MNKTELVDAIAKKAEASKDATKKMVDALQDVITDALAKGDNVALVGFGTFEVTEKAARTARNPKDGSPIQIAACKQPKFKVGKALKEAVNK